MNVAITMLIMGLGGFGVAVRGAFASRERLRSMSGIIGVKNHTAARIICWVGMVVCLGFATGGGVVGYMKSTLSSSPQLPQVEKAVHDGLKEKTRRDPVVVTLQEQGEGKYSGSALFEKGEVWDITALVDGSTIRWEARERKLASQK